MMKRERVSGDASMIPCGWMCSLMPARVQIPQDPELNSQRRVSLFSSNYHLKTSFPYELT